MGEVAAKVVRPPRFLNSPRLGFGHPLRRPPDGLLRCAGEASRKSCRLVRKRVWPFSGPWKWAAQNHGLAFATWGSMFWCTPEPQKYAQCARRGTLQILIATGSGRRRSSRLARQPPIGSERGPRNLPLSVPDSRQHGVMVRCPMHVAEIPTMAPGSGPQKRKSDGYG